MKHVGYGRLTKRPQQNEYVPISAIESPDSPHSSMSSSTSIITSVSRQVGKAKMPSAPNGTAKLVMYLTLEFSSMIMYGSHMP